MKKSDVKDTDDITARLGTLTLPQKSRRLCFNNASQLRSLTRESFAVPSSKTFAAIDAILPDAGLVNVTINVNHDLLLYAKGDKQGLISVAAALGLSKGPIRFYWAMPKDRYNKAMAKGEPLKVTLGNIVAGDDKKMATAAEYQSRIEQYLLLVDTWPQHLVTVNAPDKPTAGDKSAADSSSRSPAQDAQTARSDT